MNPELLEKIRRNISTAEVSIKSLRLDIDNAKRAGIDVKDQERRLADQIKRVAALKNVYLT